MRYFYYTVIEEENGKYYAYADRVAENNNIFAYFDRKNMKAVQPMHTFKEAKETAEFWNECSKKNGTYMF